MSTCVVCFNDATLKCCFLGKFCSETCRKLYVGNHNEMEHVYVVAPHTCIVAQIEDPPCDFKTLEIAKRLHKKLQSNSTLLVNNRKRSIVDGNRLEGRNEPFRQKLRDIAKKGDYVIEIHSFHSSNDFKVGDSIDVVILSMYEDDQMEKTFYYNLSRTAIRKGHKRVNDIGYESHKRGLKHIMLEFRDTLSDEQIEIHLNEIKEILYTIN